MVFAFLEDGTLEVHASAADAIREYEGIDVESGVYELVPEPESSKTPSRSRCSTCQ